MPARPRVVFVGSSTEGLGLAQVIRDALNAGTLDRLGRHLPRWEPGIELKRRSATTWAATLEGPDGVSLEYKDMLGPPWDWSHVEAWPDGSERTNRHLILRRAPIHDTVESWR